MNFMKQIVLASFLLSSTLVLADSYSGFFLSGGLGTETHRKENGSNGSTNTWKQSYFGSVGYALPAFLSGEIFFSTQKYDLVGADARLTVLPFISIKGGAFQTLGSENEKGVLGGVGINFWPIPKIDVFADATFYSKIETIEGIVGLRYYFN